MGEVYKLLQESEKRMKQIADLIRQNSAGDSGFEKLLEAAKELDSIKIKSKKEQSALERCNQVLSSAESYSVVKETFETEIKKPTKEKSKKDKGFHESLKKHIDQQDEDILEVEQEKNEAIDPWTRQPIQNPVQSSSCKHLYDKKSINCIIKNRPHFKCPYVGCQNVVTKDQLVDVEQ